MKRILVVLGLVSALGMVFGTIPAGAGAGNNVTVTLSCDRGVTATVTATFVVNSTGGFGGQCGGTSPKSFRQVIDVPDPETAVLLTKFEVVSTETVDCAQQVSVPTTLDCGGARTGAKLTVR